jgi:hypothetical protein
MFDLTKYLANNPLLNEGLSNQEQDIVDDILSVTEGVNDIVNKLKNYAKKGLLTAAIISSVIGQLQAQNQDKIANQIPLELSLELNDSLPAYSEIEDNIPNKTTLNKIVMASKKGKDITAKYPTLEWDQTSFSVDPVTVNGITYQVTVYELADQENLYKYEFTKNKIADPYLSFYALTEPSINRSTEDYVNLLNIRDLIDQNIPTPFNPTLHSSLLKKYTEDGWEVIDEVSITKNDVDFKLTYLTDTDPFDLGDYIGVFSKNGKVLKVIEFDTNRVKETA